MYEGVRAETPLPGPLSPAVLARNLVDLKHMDKESFEIFEELRHLRNQASHARDVEPSIEDAKAYVRLALELTIRIRYVVWGRPSGDGPTGSPAPLAGFTKNQ